MVPDAPPRRTATLVTMRRRLGVSIAATVVTGLVLSGLALTIAKSPQERDEIRAADNVARIFDDNLDRYVAESGPAVRRVHARDTDGYPALLRFLEERIANAPDLPSRGTTAYGRSHSEAYKQELGRRKFALMPLVGLSTYLRARAIPNSRFVSAGRKLVKLSPESLLSKEPITTGRALRELVLPAFEKARDRMKAQQAPEGSDLLLLDLNTYADDVIAMTEKGAKALDEGKPFFYELGDRPDQLYQRLVAVESAIENDVSQKVEVFVAGQ